MTKPIIDKKQVAANRARAERLAVPGADVLFARALDELSDRLAVVRRDFARALAVGPLAERVCARLAASGKVAKAEPAVVDEAEVLVADPRSADLIVSLMHLHQVDDVPGLLIQMRRVLEPDGLLLACVPASGTLAELRKSLLEAETAVTGGASPRVLPFMDVRDAGALLQRAGLAMPVTDTDAIDVRYDTMFDLMADLRAMGATNTLLARRRNPTPRRVFFEAERRYADDHADPDGRVRASFAFVWMSGWAPSESQPRPLAPGSATHSLADALKDRSGG
ncbi:MULTISPECIES: methyltransferase domain-containing protein [unclassified Roseitalea]|uniref:methyltransferase domain-containing protein n=1 Tax=unclassified Roseitalea TaxID=2639107 RepID=UPI00273E8105|nr:MULTISPECIES: methyltransferase domain-containing protein [unclassified Roseitalea]